MDERWQRIVSLSPQKLAIYTMGLQAKLEKLEQKQSEPIAIVGMGCRFPGQVNDPDSLWQLLRQGRSAIREIPSSRWDVDALYDPDPDVLGKICTRWGGFLDDIDQFDPHFFGISPREAVSMDPQQRLLLMVAWETLENGGIAPASLFGTRTGVFVGIGSQDYSRLHTGATEHSAILDPYYSSGNANSIAPGRLSYVLGVHGPSIAIDTACSSSLVAIHLACQSLRCGESDLALAGGVNLIFSPAGHMALSRAKMLSVEGRCKTFDAAADGFVRSEGCGLVALKRLSDAREQGDRILALVRGSAINQDGRSTGLTAPNGLSQESVLQAALKSAQVTPQQVSYIEAHGTGTALGDPIELQALGNVFRERPSSEPLLVGSAKANFGHMETVAGVGGLLKLVMMMQQKTVAPHINLNVPNPHVPWEQLPIQIPTTLQPWTVTAGSRIAGVSSFGFSGTNAHIILEEAIEVTRATAIHDGVDGVQDSQPVSDHPSLQPDRPLHLLTLSAKNSAALDQLTQRFQHYLQSPASHSASFSDICFTANSGRSHFSHRLALLAPSLKAAQQYLSQHLQGEETDYLSTGVVPSNTEHRVAFLFTGQGSQYVGMGAEFYHTQPIFRQILEQCDAYLQQLPTDLFRQYPLTQVLGSATNAEVCLSNTAYSQPALFALEYALVQLWQSWGVYPDAVIGHSLGEYTAACVAGVFSWEEGLKLVAARGELMETLALKGAMLTIFASELQVKRYLEALFDTDWQTYLAGNPKVVIAAVNAPEQVVVSGDGTTIRQIEALLDREQVRCKMLSDRYAFHSPFVIPAAKALAEVALSIKPATPRVNFISTLTGQWVQLHSSVQHQDGASDLTQYWAQHWQQHLQNPVHFAAGIETLHQSGYNRFIEIGPNPLLLNLARQTIPETGNLWCPSLRSGHPDWQLLLTSLQNLYLAGMDINWKNVDRDYAHRRVQLPTYPFQTHRYWLDHSNFSSSSFSPFPNFRDTLHPLLGQELPTPLSQRQFQSYLHPTTPEFLQQHQVSHQVVLPATAYLEIALAAATKGLGLSQVQLQNLVIERALLLGDTQPTLVQTVLNYSTTSCTTLQIFSCTSEPSSPTQQHLPSWIRHATIEIESNKTHSEIGSNQTNALSSNSSQDLESQPEFNLERIRDRCPVSLDVAGIYEKLLERDLQLGAIFQGIQALWQGEEEAIAQIQLPGEAEATVNSPGATSYLIHPALLDACFQVLVATLPTQTLVPEEANYLPIAVDQFRFYGSPGYFCWCHAQVRSPFSVEAPVGDLELYDANGKLLVVVEGLRFKKLRQDLGEVDLSGWFFDLKWHLLGPLPTQNKVRTSQITLSSLEQKFPPLSPEPALKTYNEMVEALEQRSVAYIVRAFQDLGWQFPTPDSPHEPLQETQSWVQSLAQLPVAPKYKRLLNRFAEILTQEKILNLQAESEADRWVTIASHPESDAQLEAEIEALKVQYPLFPVELDLLHRCGSHLAAVMRLEVNPLHLLFPEGAVDQAQKIYTDSPIATHLGTIVQTLVRDLLDNLLPGQTLRILEIGAGTGGTTSHLVEHIAAHVREHAREYQVQDAQSIQYAVEYYFTDISPRFVTQAREKFSQYPFMEFGALNINELPQNQGYSVNSFDLVLAANVLHATQDLNQTFSHIRQLMVPGGNVILVEGIAPLRQSDLTFGLTDGWWDFKDLDLRPNYPLISQQKWFNFLETQGFTDPLVWPPEGDRDRILANQAVIMAQLSPNLDTQVSQQSFGTEPQTWLILADTMGIGEALAQQLAGQLTAAGQTIIVAQPGDTYIQVGQSAQGQVKQYQLNPCEPRDFHRLLAELSPQEPLMGVIHLWSLNSPKPEVTGLEGLKTAQHLCCDSVLHLIHALVQSTALAPPRLWLVTQAAQGHDSTLSSVSSVEQSPLWGLARVLMREHPEFRCVCLDLDASPNTELDAELDGSEPVPASAKALLWELSQPFESPGEGQISHRKGQRYGLRLVPAMLVGEQEKQGQQQEQGQENFDTVSSLPGVNPIRLEKPTTGSLEDLVFQPLKRQPPKPGEVEIEIQAAALNFRDVLSVLGLYPEDAGLLGEECAGTIVAIGSDITEFSVGDEVIAIASGCFGTYLTTQAQFVRPKPKQLTFEEATTFPIAFLTAAFALEQVGQIQQGDRILIHAAAGGVGMAAIQLAQQAGAEVFATASLPKWETLRSLGVEHIMNSRTLEFADAIKQKTHGQGVDLVLNCLNGDFIPKSLSVLSPGGRFLEIGRRGILSPEQMSAERPDVAYFPIVVAHEGQKNPQVLKAVLDGVIARFNQGLLKPLSAQLFPLADAKAAFRHMERGQHIGKIVLTQTPSALSTSNAQPARQSTRTSLAEVRPKVEGQGTYLITGGLGGIGLQVADWLTTQGAQHLVLLSRRPSSPEVEQQLALLKGKGAQVEVMAADVSSRADLEQVIETIAAQMPPLKGLFHGAGVLSDGILLQQTPEQFTQVMAAKVNGAWLLHELTMSMDLDFFVLFSAGAALFGSPGQSNHAAANTFLDALAFYRRDRGLPALSINWGPWSEVGAAAHRDLNQHALLQGMGVIQPQSGLRAMALAMAQQRPQVAILPLQRRQFLGQFPPGTVPRFFSALEPELVSRLQASSTSGLQPTSALADRSTVAVPTQAVETSSAVGVSSAASSANAQASWLQLTSTTDRYRFLFDQVQSAAAKILAWDQAQPLDPHVPLHDLGLDSLMAVELRNALSRDLSLPLPATLLFDYPTVEALVGYLEETISPLIAQQAPDVETEETTEEVTEIGPETTTDSSDSSLGTGSIDSDAIAIVGIGCRFPGGVVDADTFWQLLQSGTDAVQDRPPKRWGNVTLPQGVTSIYGGYLEKIDGFDARFFGIAPIEAVSMDPQQRFLLEVAWEALEDAGIPTENLAGSPTGVFVGICGSEYLRLLTKIKDNSQPFSLEASQPDPQLYAATGNSASVAAGRIAYTLGLHGPTLSVDTACSSSLVAMHLACQSLRQGECNLALVGAVNLILGPETAINFSKLGLLADDGRCKAFDASADGYVRSEGCGVVVLKPLKMAQQDGDRVIAVIRGSAVNHDGRSSGLTAPNGPAQERVIQQALAQANVAPETIGYVETHGTGTPLGDPIEAQALGAVIQSGRSQSDPLWIGSVKSNFGHLEAAAGIAGVIKAALILRQGEIPPHLHFQTPNPLIPWETLPLSVAQKPIPWAANGHPRRVGISSFGFSGTNSHLILEEAPKTPVPNIAAPKDTVSGGGDNTSVLNLTSGASSSAKPAYLLPLSARSAEALEALGQRYLEMLETLQTEETAELSGASDARQAPSTALPTLQDTLSLANICYTASVRRSHHPHRLALVGESCADLVVNLKQFLAQQSAAPEQTGYWRSGYHSPGTHQTVVFVFPGQGSQWVGMAQELLEHEPIFREALTQCDRVICDFTGWSVIEQISQADSFDRIEVVQPLLFAIQVSLATLWQSRGIKPDCVIGHSMGEVAAAHVAGALTLKDAAWIICHRSELLKQLAGKGAMLLVNLSIKAVQTYIDNIIHQDYDAINQVSIAVSNSTQSTVLSGSPATLDILAETFRSENIFCRPIKVTVASHSPQVDILREPLIGGLQHLQPHSSSIPIYSTVMGQVIAGDELNADYWFRNLREPVLFSQAVQAVLSENNTNSSANPYFIEISPHPILLSAIETEIHDLGQNLEQNVGRSNSLSVPGTAIVCSSLKREEPECAALLQSLGQLYVAGQKVLWHCLYPQGGDLVHLPTYPWQHQRFWIEEQILQSQTPQIQSQQVSQEQFHTPQQPQHLPTSLYDICWRQQSLPAYPLAAEESTAGSESQAWLIFVDRQGIGQALADQFSNRGDSCFLVESGSDYGQLETTRWQINPAQESDFQQLLRDIQANVPLADNFNLLYLWGLDLHEVSLHEMSTRGSADVDTPLGKTLDDVQGTIADACETLIFLVRAIALVGKTSKIWMVTSGAQGLEAEDPIALTQSPLWGFGRVAALEHPELWGGLVDLPRHYNPNLAAMWLYQEFTQVSGSAPEDQIAWREEQRYVARLVEKQPSTNSMPLNLADPGTYLITGGLGGIGLQLAQWLAKQGVRHLALIGRTALPPREQWSSLLPNDRAIKPIQTIQALEAQGVKVLVFQADVGNLAAMERVLETLQHSAPPLRGLFHVAGTTRPELITALKRDDLEAVLYPKVQAIWELYSLLMKWDINLDYFVLFSSAAAIWGAKAMSHYAAANQFLNALAHELQRQGCSALSVNWSWWGQSGMVSQEAVDFFSQIGLDLTPPEVALEILGDLMAGAVTQRTVAAVDWSVFRPIYEAKRQRNFLDEIVPSLATQSHLVSKVETHSEQTNLQTSAQNISKDKTLKNLGIFDDLAQESQSVALEQLRGWVSERIAKLLGFESLKAADESQGFFQLGMDSIMASKLRIELEAALDLALPPTVAFEYPTVVALTEFLFEQLRPWFSEAETLEPGLDMGLDVESPTPELTPDSSDVLERISQLSDDEIDRLLREKFDHD